MRIPLINIIMIYTWLERADSQLSENQLRIEVSGAIWKSILNILLKIHSKYFVENANKCHDVQNDVNIAVADSCCTSCKHLI